MEYGQYLQSEHWQKTRFNKLTVRPSCQVCGSSKKLHIHHKRYKVLRENESILYKERNEDLVTLCASCHRLLHIYFGVNVYKLNKKILRIRRLLALGVTKKLAFYFSSQDELFSSIKDRVLVRAVGTVAARRIG